MASDFRYATQTDLIKYYNKIHDYDSKRIVYGWEQVGGSGNVWRAYNVGYVSQLFKNGAEQGANISEGGAGVKWSANIDANLDSGPDSDVTLYNTISYSAMVIETEDEITIGDIGRLTQTGYSGEEFALVTAINTSTNKITVERGKRGSSPYAWDASSAVFTDYYHLNSGEWYYNESDDELMVYSTTDPNDDLYEVGVDQNTFLNQALTDGALELHNLLDMRFSTPVEKSKQIDLDTTVVAVEEEYDPIIIKSNCYITIANLIRAKDGQSEEADYFYSLVTNSERTGLIDKLNDGIYKLSYETDANDKKGKIKYRSVSGTMDIVEVAGTYSGELYDLIKIEIESTGAYGVATYKTHYYGSDKIYGTTSGTDVITGGLQELEGGGGIYVRFQGASATDGDIWELEVVDNNKPQTNKSSSTIEMIR